MRNDGFFAGVLTGALMGALLAIAMTPQVRRPMMEGMSEFGHRMRKILRRSGRMTEEILPGEGI